MNAKSGGSEQIGVSGFKKRALTLALWLVLGVPHAALSGDSKSAVDISYTPPLLTVEARDVNLLQVLREIGDKVGFSVENHGLSDTIVNVSIQNGTVEEVLRQLLRGENFAVGYWTPEKEPFPASRTIAKILLLSPPGHAQAAQNPGITAQRVEESFGVVSREGGLSLRQNSALKSTGLTRYSTESFQTQGRTNEESEAGVTVEAIMRAHTLSSLADSIEGDTRGFLGERVSQPLGNQAGLGGPLIGSTANRQTPVDINEALAISTYLAQQNLRALVNGLATAERSLFHSLGD